MTAKRTIRAFAALLLGLAGSLGAAPAPIPDIRLAPAFPKLSFEKPVFLTHLPDGTGRLAVIEQQGKGWIFPNRPDADRMTLFLDVVEKTTPVPNEMGLLGLAFHPRFKENGFLYVHYSERPKERTPGGAHEAVVVRLRMPPDAAKADPASATEILRIRQPYWNHNGGCLQFGPDGFLYLGLGDGGAGGDPHGNGQSRKTLLGKMLRIDVDHPGEGRAYGIPKDNPFARDARFLPEIWAWGLRNPWRFSFDRRTGDLWCGDVGQSRREEIDIVQKGRNYGWSDLEGTVELKGKAVEADAYVMPLHEYRCGAEGRSVIGGCVYRGKAFPGLDGVYLFGDHVSGNVWGLRQEDGKAVSVRELVSGGPPVASFGEDEAGEVYLLAYGTSWRRGEPGIHRIAPKAE